MENVSEFRTSMEKWYAVAVEVFKDAYERLLRGFHSTHTVNTPSQYKLSILNCIMFYRNVRCVVPLLLFGMPQNFAILTGPWKNVLGVCNKAFPLDRSWDFSEKQSDFLVWPAIRYATERRPLLLELTVCDHASFFTCSENSPCANKSQPW